jgi:methyl-accepting chemotaxis protein
VAISLAVMSACGFTLAKSLMLQLGAEPPDLRQFANHIAQGQLAARLQGVAQAPTGSVAAAMISMQQALCETVASIRESSDSVATGSEQIASGNLELSSRTERQASRLQATAASMEELSGIVKQTAGHARLASELADAASRVAQLGGESVQRAEQTMAALQTSSSRISDITGVIDSIAFQTNILALNAAVESARAGEQGRGFAVVASEVRGLAQRSAHAAREIKLLIKASLADVDAGNRTVVEAGRTMRDIQGGVLRVTELIGEIHAASSRQDSSIGQVAVSVADLDRDTQDNAALVEETAAASQSLSAQAQRLTQAVASFQLYAA